MFSFTFAHKKENLLVAAGLVVAVLTGFSLLGTEFLPELNKGSINVPFASIAARLITHVNFSISAGIGFIALFGICIQNGVILISVFPKNPQNCLSMRDSVFEGCCRGCGPW